MGHGAWCITVRVSEPALVYYGAMHHALCPMRLSFRIPHSEFRIPPALRPDN